MSAASGVFPALTEVDKRAKKAVDVLQSAIDQLHPPRNGETWETLTTRLQGAAVLAHRASMEIATACGRSESASNGYRVLLAVGQAAGAESVGSPDRDRDREAIQIACGIVAEVSLNYNPTPKELVVFMDALNGLTPLLMLLERRKPRETFRVVRGGQLDGEEREDG